MKFPLLSLAILLGSAGTVSGDTPGKLDEASTEKQAPSFAGDWATEFGPMRLSVAGNIVFGNYRLGSLTGTLQDGRMAKLRYQEANAKGDAEFTLAEDGGSWRGRWRQDGEDRWLPWNGKRIVTPPLGFGGLWETSFGAMRLTAKESEVHGAYDYPGGVGSIEGQVKEKRLIFRYKEPDAEGSGWFELSEDRQSIRGKWRPDGQTQWSDWIGKRKPGEPGRIWLVILEANWERSIDEQEYAFGDMLSGYFKMATARHVQVRHRFFHDATDLKRFCSKIQFLAEPVVLLISTHGTPQGITVFGKTIDASVLAESLASASNLKLLHLSGCGMMSGDFPRRIQTLLKDRVSFPISGYKTTVAWDASALGDFTFLSLLLIRGMEPEVAAKQAIMMSPYLGQKRVSGAAFAPLGLTLLPAAEDR